MANKSIIVFIIILFNSSVLLLSEEPEVIFSQQQDLKDGSYLGSALLSLKKSKIELGKKFSIDIRFTNKSGGDYFYNSFFSRLIPLPAELAIYNSKKEYIGEILQGDGGSARTVGSHDWQFIPSNCYVGTQLQFTAGYIPGTKHGSMSNLLPPGEYYLQMIYYEAFVSRKLDELISNPPNDNKSQIKNFYKNFDRSELFRSNVVKIILIKNLSHINSKIPSKKEGSKLIAKIGDYKISEREVFGGPSVDLLRLRLEKNLAWENRLFEEEGKEEKFPTDDAFIDKLIPTILQRNLQAELKRVVDNLLLANHIEEIISNKDVRECFVQQSKSSNDLNYKRYESLKNAYEYLDNNPGHKNALKEAYNKYLTKIFLEKRSRKPKDYGFKIWKSYTRNEKTRKYHLKKYNYYKNLLSSNLTDEMKIQIRNNLFYKHPEKINSYIIKQCAKTDEKVKKYLEEKNKTGKAERNFEQAIINKWYLKELQKLECKLYTDKYGTLEEIMTVKAIDWKKFLLNKTSSSPKP